MAVLGKVSAQDVDALHPLSHQQIGGLEHKRVRLLRFSFNRHKPHVWPLRRFANGLSISHIAVLPLDEGLYLVSIREQIE